MIDLKDTMQTESDRLTADDLMINPVIIKVTKVVKYKTEKGKPAFYLNYEGDLNKPFKPCLGMRKMIIACWGDDGSVFMGRKLKLYRDPSARFGAEAVGGVRVSHVSDITDPVTLLIAISRKKKQSFTINPLIIEPEKPPRDLKSEAESAAMKGTETLTAFWATLTNPEKASLKPDMETIKKVAASNDPCEEEDK